MSDNKWNDLVKQSVAENKRQADLEAWWNKPVPMPEPRVYEKPVKPERSYDDNYIPTNNKPAENISIPSGSDRVQSAWTCFLIALVLLSVTISVITFLDVLQ